MPIAAVSTFERFFRTVGGVDVDKSDLRRFDEILNARIAAMLLRAREIASSNGRDVVEPQDVPITEGLRRSIIDFRKLDRDLGMSAILGRETAIPQIGVTPSADTEARLPEIAGGLAVALARTFALVDPHVKNPAGAQWERVARLFELLL
jgi:hypothetical protein